MANPFIVKPVISQTDDPTTVKVTDDSNYGTNDDGITTGMVISRTAIITDYLGNTVNTILLTLQLDGSWAASQVLTKDVYYAFNLVVELSGPLEKTGNTDYVTIGYYNQKFLSIMVNQMGDCGCDDGICSDLGWARHYKEAALLAGLKSQGANAQKFIDASNSFLDDILNGQ